MATIRNEIRGVGAAREVTAAWEATFQGTSRPAVGARAVDARTSSM